ncbi:MAG: leucine-rich repeat domain-containing protein [Christensenellaceae bacterium]|jgi:hypothetical protein|nr:leucine-rich repeat domain-containing protein [Christensenellaceae bacterium]
MLDVGRRTYKTFIIIIVFCFLAIFLSACNNADKKINGKVPTFLDITAKRVNGPYDVNKVLCVSTVKNVCEPIIIEIELINNDKRDISSLKINDKTYKPGGNSETTFSISTDKTLLSLTYVPTEVSGEVTITVSDIYYKINDEVFVISIFSANSIIVKIDPTFVLTTYVPIDEDYVIDFTKLPSGSVLIDDTGRNYVADFNISFLDIPSAIEGIYKDYNMTYSIISAHSLKFCKSAYGFAGWFTGPNGTGDLFNLDEKYNFESDVSIYAFFEPLYNYVISTNEEHGEYATIVSLTKTGKNTSSLNIFYEIDGYKIREIGDYAFKGANNNEISINLAIFSIGTSAFEDFTGNISFNTVDETKENKISDYEKSSITEIKNRAFANWAYKYGTTNFFIPESVESIGSEAFLGTCWDTATSFILSIPDHTGSLKREKTLFIPANVKSIGDKAFKDSKFEYIYFMADSELEYMGEAVFQNSTNLKVFYSAAILQNTQFKKANEDSLGIKKISNSAFDGCFNGYNIDNTSYEIYLHEGLEEIGENAFFVKASEKIKQLVFPDSLQVIGDRAFANYTKLVNIVFSENSKLTRLGKYSFESSAMETIKITSMQFKLYDESPFYGNTQLVTVYIYATDPPSVNSPYLTGLATGQVKYLVPDVTAYRLKGWGVSYFPRIYDVLALSLRDATSGSEYGYELLENDEVKITYILNQSNQNSETEYIPSAILIRTQEGEQIKYVTEIGEYVANNNIVTIILPSTLKIINAYAFAGYSKLENICVGTISNKGFNKLENLEMIMESAFTGVNIDTFIAPDSIQYIARNAFSNIGSLKTVYINPSNDGCIIYAEAFARSGIETLYLGSRVDYLGDAAFGYCNKLQDVYIYRSYPPNQLPNTNMILSPFISSKNNVDFVLHVRPNAISAFTVATVYGITADQCIDDAEAIPLVSDI